MTNQLYGRGPVEPGHRYAPRRPVDHLAVNVRRKTIPIQVQVTETPAPLPPKRSRQTGAVSPAHPRQSRSAVLKRQGLNQSHPAPVNPVVIGLSGANVPKRRRPRMHLLHSHPVIVFTGSAALAAVLVFGGGLLFFKQKDSSADKYSLPATLGVSTTKSQSSTPDVNEIPPTAAELAAYKTAAAAPQLLKVPKLQLSSRIVAMQAGKDGLPPGPQNIFDAGWLAGSAKPGENGVALLSGHVAGANRLGLFSALENLGQGDTIEVERGDGKVVTYKVVRVERLGADKLTGDVALKPAVAGRAGLNLVAANSRYNIKTNTFEHRTVIFAVQQ